MKPLLKWAGGKRWLLPILKLLWEPYQQYKLVEPFTGGMSVALGLNPRLALLNDANVHLMNFYSQVKAGLQIRHLLRNDADFYYQMRDQFNALINANRYQSKKAATIFYFLIRTGFNGLCRFNNQGEFNVPFGQHKSIRYKNNFFEYQKTLKNWELCHGDFATLNLNGKEFLYVDPPYDVEFTKYVAKDFKWDDQVRLARWLSLHGGPVVASNQATNRVLELYKKLGFKIFIVEAPRYISCNGDRSPVSEILALKGFAPEVLKTITPKLKRVLENRY